MRVETYKTTYIIGIPDALMDEVRASINAWAEGDYNICVTFDEALTIDALRPLIEDIGFEGDVILCT